MKRPSPFAIGLAALVLATTASADAPGSLARWPLDGLKVNAVVAATPNLQPLPDAQLPSPDLTGIPGAKFLLKRGVGAGELRMIAVCARADASAWAPNVESLVFDKLDDVTKVELAKRGAVDAFHVEASSEVAGMRYERPFDGDLLLGLDKSKPRPLDTSGLTKAHFTGRHVLAFGGEPVEILACTMLCTETDTSVCNDFAASATMEGALVAAPNPTAIGRFMSDLARRPLAAVGVGFGILLALVGLILAAAPPRAKPSAA